MYLTENLQEKWQPVLEHPDLPKIEDSYKRAVTTVILENQEKAVREDASFISEAAPTSNTTSASNWDPVLISLVRRAMPNLIAYAAAWLLLKPYSANGSIFKKIPAATSLLIPFAYAPSINLCFCFSSSDLFFLPIALLKISASPAVNPDNA